MKESRLIDMSDTELVIEYLYSVERHLTMSIKVKSEGFSGVSNFCISKDDLSQVNKELQEMNNRLVGVTSLRDSDSDANIRFELTKHGKLEVSGQIGASYQDHFMRFKLLSDQTILNSLISFISKVE